MKKTPPGTAPEQDPGEQFDRFFPGAGNEEFDVNGPEAPVLRLVMCLHPRSVSRELLSAILGSGFPLSETLDKLVKRSFIGKDAYNGSYTLKPDFVPELVCFPLSEEISALIILISREILMSEKTGDAKALLNWADIGISVWKKFEETPDTEDFRQILEKAGRSLGLLADGERLFHGEGSSSPHPEISGSPPPSAESADNDKGSRSQPLFSSEERVTPRAALSLINSGVLFCDAVISGKNSAAGLKYDEENMFAPMIVFLEKDAAAEALVRAAENLGVVVIKNNVLAHKLSSYGKAGECVPDLSYGDVSLALSRLGSLRQQRQPRGNSDKNRRFISVVVPRPLSVEMGESLFSLTNEEPGREKLLGESFNAIRKNLARLLGFTVAPFRVTCSKRLRSDEYRILFRGIEAGRGRFDLGWYFNAGFEGVHEWQSPVPLTIIPDLMSKAENIRAAAKATSAVIIRHVNRIITRRAPELLGREEVEAILDAAEEKYPVVTGEVKGLLSLGIIREILQNLVSEQVSIRHIAVILENLADWGSFGPAPIEVIIEQIRMSLKRQICLEYTDDEMTLHVMTLEPNLEIKFADLFPSFGFFPEKSLSPGADQKIVDQWPPDLKLADPRLMNPRSVDYKQDQKPGDQKSIDQKPKDQRSMEMKPMGDGSQDQGSSDWAELILKAVHGMEEKGFPPVILCSPRARLPLKEATRSKAPDLAVLSYLEIPSDIRVEALGEIRLEGNIRLPG